jgi:uncharacterized protein with HEPN domain
MKDKSRRRIADRADDIRLAIANIRSDVGDMSKAAFLVDGKTQRAVIESLIVIGEAATHIVHAAPDLETRQNDAWRQLQDAGGMRNILAHEYFRVDAAVVWDTINNDLSSLEHALRTIGDVGG